MPISRAIRRAFFFDQISHSLSPFISGLDIFVQIWFYGSFFHITHSMTVHFFSQRPNIDSKPITKVHINHSILFFRVKKSGKWEKLEKYENSRQKMMLYLALIVVVVGGNKRPNNFDSIRHDNFEEFWRLDFENGNGALLHTSLKTIAYSIIVKAGLSI